MKRLPMLFTALLLGACGEGATDPSGVVAIDPPPTASVVVGDELSITVVADPSAGLTWASADTSVAGVTGGAAGATVEARRPGATSIEASLPDGASDQIQIQVTARPGGFQPAAIDYFVEIGFGAEYGGSSRIVRRWATGPAVRVNGTPTADDLATLSDVVGDINALTTTVDMSLVQAEPSVELHFARQADFPQILPSYVPGNVGYFSVWWDASQHIYRAVVLVSVEIDQVGRNHIIREELTQILGLMQDSYRYQDSIFQQSWTTVDRYSTLDEQLIEMLYRPELAVGSTPHQAVRLLRTLTRGGPVTLVVEPEQGVPTYPRLGPPGMASGGIARR
jgi:hypothetical protein